MGNWLQNNESKYSVKPSCLRAKGLQLHLESFISWLVYQGLLAVNYQMIDFHGQKCHRYHTITSLLSCHYRQMCFALKVRQNISKVLSDESVSVSKIDFILFVLIPCAHTIWAKCLSLLSYRWVNPEVNPEVESPSRLVYETSSFFFDTLVCENEKMHLWTRSKQSKLEVNLPVIALVRFPPW